MYKEKLKCRFPLWVLTLVLLAHARENDIFIGNGVVVETIGQTKEVLGVTILHLRVVDNTLTETLKELEQGTMRFGMNKTDEIHNLKMVCRDYLEIGTPTTLVRKKRGLINAIGEGFSFAFGLVSERGLKLALKQNKIKLNVVRKTQKELLDRVKFLFEGLNRTRQIQIMMHEEIKVLDIIEQLIIKCNAYNNLMQKARNNEVNLSDFSLGYIYQILSSVKKNWNLEPVVQFGQWNFNDIVESTVIDHNTIEAKIPFSNGEVFTTKRIQKLPMFTTTSRVHKAVPLIDDGVVLVASDKKKFGILSEKEFENCKSVGKTQLFVCYPFIKFRNEDAKNCYIELLDNSSESCKFTFVGSEFATVKTQNYNIISARPKLLTTVSCEKNIHRFFSFPTSAIAKFDKSCSLNSSLFSLAHVTYEHKEVKIREPLAIKKRANKPRITQPNLRIIQSYQRPIRYGGRYNIYHYA